MGGVSVPAERTGPGGSGLIMVKPSSKDAPTRLVASGTHRGEKDESFAEVLGEIPEQGLSGCLEFMHHFVGADGVGPHALELFSHRRLARADATRESDHASHGRDHIAGQAKRAEAV